MMNYTIQSGDLLLRKVGHLGSCLMVAECIWIMDMEAANKGSVKECLNGPDVCVCVISTSVGSQTKLLLILVSRNSSSPVLLSIIIVG